MDRYKRNAGLTTVRYFEGLQKHINKGRRKHKTKTEQQKRGTNETSANLIVTLNYNLIHLIL
jgi:hypothetical protein